jgi:hypothetical protein
MNIRTLVITYKTTQCHDPEDHNPHFHCHENLKPHEKQVVSVLLLFTYTAYIIGRGVS